MVDLRIGSSLHRCLEKQALPQTQSDWQRGAHAGIRLVGKWPDYVIGSGLANSSSVWIQQGAIPLATQRVVQSLTATHSTNKTVPQPTIYLRLLRAIFGTLSYVGVFCIEILRIVTGLYKGLAVLTGGLLSVIFGLLDFRRYFCKNREVSKMPKVDHNLKSSLLYQANSSDRVGTLSQTHVNESSEIVENGHLLERLETKMARGFNTYVAFPAKATFYTGLSIRKMFLLIDYSAKVSSAYTPLFSRFEDNLKDLTKRVLGYLKDAGAKESGFVKELAKSVLDLSVRVCQDTYDKINNESLRICQEYERNGGCTCIPVYERLERRLRNFRTLVHSMGQFLNSQQDSFSELYVDSRVKELSLNIQGLKKEQTQYMIKERKIIVDKRFPSFRSMLSLQQRRVENFPHEVLSAISNLHQDAISTPYLPEGKRRQVLSGLRQLKSLVDERLSRDQKSTESINVEKEEVEVEEQEIFYESY